MTLFLATLLMFLIPRLAPGDPIQAILTRLTEAAGEYQEQQQVEVEVVQHYKALFGLDKDLLTQYLLFLYNALRGDLGPSIMGFPRSVSELIAERLPWTIYLLGIATIISWVAGNLLGAFVGWSEKMKTNALIISICISISRVPFYIFSLVLMYLFVYTIPLFPYGGAKSFFTTPGFNIPYILDVLYHSFLPALSIILASLGLTMMGMRALIQSIRGSDFLKFAEAKGLSKNTIFVKYTFRNALLPSATSLAMSLGFMLGGSMLVEWIFSYPGVGLLFISSLLYFDYNTMNGVFLMTTFGVLTANLILDLIYPLIDPRVRSE